jgi:hypothetical protein
MGEFMVDRVVLGYVFLQVLGLTPTSFIAPTLHTHSPVTDGM